MIKDRAPHLTESTIAKLVLMEISQELGKRGIRAATDDIPMDATHCGAVVHDDESGVTVSVGFGYSAIDNGTIVGVSMKNQGIVHRQGFKLEAEELCGSVRDMHETHTKPVGRMFLQYLLPRERMPYREDFSYMGV